MRKKITLFLLAFGTAFVLTACSTEKPDVPGSNVRNGNGTSADMDVAGADWRTTGIVFANGTITRGGEDTAVLVFTGQMRHFTMMMQSRLYTIRWNILSRSVKIRWKHAGGLIFPI